MLELFLSALVTFFVAIDPPGVAPIFAALTEGSPKAHRRAMAYKSVMIASGVLLAFALGGRFLLDAMHISLDAFRTAGGVLLFLMALEMIFEKRTERREERAEKLTEEHENHPEVWDDISVFPMAIPMLAGPGAIATIMLFMSEAHTVAYQAVVFGAVGINLLLCLGVFLVIGPVMKFVGASMAAMITRILGVILAALATQFIFDGIHGAFMAG
ncbi:MarC family protein [uncultured Maricaulis sp.]|uniref:MarC family protein n=1 Tax=uncultured Maricaulis sp. TaxID=174710 RepID=UPI0030DA29C5|tara:strand:+ start:6437 stop:7078 length:642 start_codon:yes stop_codon:yes gene_type:complete